ncbi:hypothetical protein RCL1_002206 [Eukaryota sp. TZLM3-RCL]
MISLHLDVKTSFGEDVFFTGTPTNWSIDHALPLTYISDFHWHLDLQHDPADDFEYKYIIKNGSTVVWEDGPNRSHGSGSTFIHDFWTSPKTYECPPSHHPPQEQDEAAGLSTAGGWESDVEQIFVEDQEVPESVSPSSSPTIQMLPPLPVFEFDTSIPEPMQFEPEEHHEDEPVVPFDEQDEDASMTEDVSGDVFSGTSIDPHYELPRTVEVPRVETEEKPQMWSKFRKIFTRRTLPIVLFVVINLGILVYSFRNHKNYS